MSEIAVRLENVTRRFGITAAVRDLSLHIRRGDAVSLVGHSGCGKSTLLRMIAGVDTPESGRIFLEGREVASSATFVEPEARGVGFVFQDYALFPHLTVRDNILFGLKRHPKGEAIAQAEEMISKVGIEHLTHRYPHTLSGGEQQRVALARALAPRPSIVLMDEPFSNLDQGLRGKVRSDTLNLLRTLGTTVIIVTHDPQEALSVGDQVVLMRAGEIVQSGSAYDLHDRPTNAYAAEFFCASSRVPGVYRDGWIETVIGNFAYRLDRPPASSVTVYIRPHAIALSRGSGIAARIESRVLHGEFEQITLKVDGLEEPLKTRALERLPASAENIQISILPERLLAF
ncbi:ABC transporter ATP-binding protein [Rhizobium bangladeshense]|uniref:ABC transporter ATP-binding protein n=1 Tax=Rhizobium bangladeshense TaxID=1138189 RepID=UPI001C83809F|nr:ABC transporter ATP-binding protein [Rhizobium bangladeshense]MBX4868540.1 ABC transporter ATP-binding protein [Rhizobium bangladeshense]MBX4920254.1 ABC transporter ATP-binding protein [Rhizobium bangladeshense]